MTDWGHPTLSHYRDLPVLVTGSTGFLGSRLVQILNRLGACITQTNRIQINDPNNNHLPLDITDAQSVQKLFGTNQFAIIFHLAGWVSRSNSTDDVRIAHETNVIGTLNILDSVMQYQPSSRIVIPGSTLEDLDMFSPYSVSKRSSFLYCDLYRKLYSSKITILKLCLTYGPYQKTESLVPYIINCILSKTQNITLELNRQCDALYIDDVIKALILGGLSNIENSVIDIGTGQFITIKDIADTILHLMNQNPNLITYKHQHILPENNQYPTDISKANRSLDWAPEWSLAEGLRNTILWYTKHFGYNENTSSS